jgi:hypothetical protein
MQMIGRGSGRFNPNERVDRYSLSMRAGGLQNWHGHREEKHVCTYRGIEPGFLGCPTCNPVIILSYPASQAYWREDLALQVFGNAVARTGQ